MNQIIPAKYYRDPALFEREKERIFSKEWLFAGIKLDIPAAKDWFTLDLFGKSIIFYNTGKEIKAFQNVCAHRFNRIFTEDHGNGPILCKYHLWAYDNEGQMMGKRDLCPEPEGKPCLKSYKVELVGDFIFFHLSGNPPHTLKEQLTDELYDLLLSYSGKIKEKIHAFDLPHSCNWKFLVENVIEQQHCVAVHMETLGKTGFCGSGEPLSQTYSGKNSFFKGLSVDVALEKKRMVFLKHIFEKEVLNDMYQHILMYPNGVISILEGASYVTGRIIPKNESESVFKVRMYTTKFREKTYQKAIDDFNEISKNFAVSVFMEDKRMLDLLQEGVKQIEHDGYQYKSEKRVGWFADTYLESMNGGE